MSRLLAIFLTCAAVATANAQRVSIAPEDAAAYDRLIAEADSALADRLYAVTDKTGLAPSGDKHDYLSLAPYWWPDPRKSDGLPWIRRDGERNPGTRGDNVDVSAKRAALNNIETLARAAYLSGEETYARRAVAQLDTWFLDPATRMNPNLDYAQGVPGRSTGRRYGIIEFAGIRNVIRSLELIDELGELPPEVKSGMRDWLADFLGWLETSRLGKLENQTKNNHGSWYDVSVTAIQRYLGREEAARQRLSEISRKRILRQIKKDGRQPHELARTKSLSYSNMNLKALTLLYLTGRELGIAEFEKGQALEWRLLSAYYFLLDYVDGDLIWSYPQLGDLNEVLADTKRLFIDPGGRLMEGAHDRYLALLPADDPIRLRSYFNEN